MWFERNGRTHPTRCRDCGADVFFHTNGFGDAVLFDELGWPWPVHECWRMYVADKSTDEELGPSRRPGSDLKSLERREFRLQGFRSGITVTTEQRPQYDESVRAYESERATLGDDAIARVEPKNFVGVVLDEIVGVVQVVLRKHRLPEHAKSGIGRSVWARAVGNRPGQMTVIDFDYNSYTFRVADSDAQGVRSGDLVKVSLNAVEVTGIGQFFLCDRLEKLTGEFSSDDRSVDV